MAKDAMSAAVLQDLLAEQGVEIRFNEIVHREEVFDRDGVLNDSEQPLDTLIAYVCDRYRDEYRYCGRDQIAQALHLIATRHPYNPILEAVQSRARQGVDSDFIGEIIGDVMRIPQDDIISAMLIRKWFMQAMAMAQNDARNPYGGEGILVLHGAQGVGKSLFCAAAAIDARYYRAISVNPYADEADTLSKAHGVFVGEFAEIEKSLKPSTLEFFKAFITSGKDSFRPKYGRAVNDYTRRSSYIGTCNTDGFLIDRTGNRRFWVVPCGRQFDIKRLTDAKEIFLAAYAQAFLTLERDGVQSFRLTDTERQQVEERNEKYVSVTEVAAAVKEIVTEGLAACDLEEFTIDDLKERFSELKKYDNSAIGRVLTRLEIPQRIRKKERDGRQITQRVYSYTGYTELKR